MKIEHIALYVNDLEAAKDFFVRYFDAVPNAGYHNPRTDFRSYFLTFADGARLELMNKPGMPDEPKPAARTGYAHIAFSVGSREKVDALTARLKADGFEVLSGPRSGGRKSDRDHGVTQKSRACGENPQVSALFVMDLSARQHHNARRSK
jgi:lactoylglutathione lyase